MSQVDLQDLQSFQNPQKVYAWRIQFFGVDVDGLDGLTYQVATANLPQRETDTLERHTFGGRVQQYAGKTQLHGTDSYEFVVDSNQSSVETLYQWAQLVENNKTRQGKLAEDYMGNINQELIKVGEEVNTEAEIGDTYVLKSVWPSNPSDFDGLDYNQKDGNLRFTADFTYSSWYKEENPGSC